jgi:hypothetical protein
MLDVHPPHAPTHGWRDFFIHIATIVVGLLIAVGLEQTVEHFHERQQLGELRRGAITDARIYLHDVDQLRSVNAQQIEDLSARVRQVQQAMAQHHAPVPPTYRPLPYTNTIRLGNLNAAKTSGLIHLFSEEEITSIGDAEVAVVKSEALKERAQEAARRRMAFEQHFQPEYPAGPFDFSSITPAQTDEYLSLLLAERVNRQEFLDYLDLMHRGGEAYLNGERDLERLREAEFGSLPSPK